MDAGELDILHAQAVRADAFRLYALKDGAHFVGLFIVCYPELQSFAMPMPKNEPLPCCMHRRTASSSSYVGDSPSLLSLSLWLHEIR